MLLNVTLLWLLLMVMRMWMFSTGKMPDFLSTLSEKKNSFLFFSFCIYGKMYQLHQWLKQLLLLFHFKTDLRRSFSFIMNLGAV